MQTVPPELEGLRRFHGHLGPYVVIGYRMGALARARLGEGKMSAVVDTGLRPPLSCIIDGIQFSTACTLGKGNIRVDDKDLPGATFRLGDGELSVLLKKEWRERIDREMSKENELEQSLFYFTTGEKDLFEVLGPSGSANAPSPRKGR